MNLGSERGCLRNHFRVPPVVPKSVRFDVEAYVEFASPRAACVNRTPLDFTVPHSVTLEDDFRDEWQAVSDAMFLRHSVFDSLQWDSVDACLSFVSCTSGEWVGAPLSGLALSSSSVIGETSASSAPSAAAPPDRGVVSEVAEGWISDLQAFHSQYAFDECLEQGPVIYVRSWFLHSFDRHVSDVFRVLRLVRDPEDWFSEIMDIWGDLFEPTAPFAIWLVQPVSPASVTETISADLIVVQAPAPELVAVLFVKYDERHDDYRLHRVAALVPPVVSMQGVLNFLDWGPLGAFDLCTVRFQELAITDALDQNPALSDGALVLAYFSVQSESFDAVSFVQSSVSEVSSIVSTVPCSQLFVLLHTSDVPVEFCTVVDSGQPFRALLWRPPFVQDDLVSFMQRERSRSRDRPLEDDVESDSLVSPHASSASGYSPADDVSWSLASLDNPSIGLHVDADFSGPTIDQVAPAIGAPASAIHAVHVVHHAQDLGSENVAIVQFIDASIAPADFAHILLDITCHREQPLDDAFVEPHHFRLVQRWPTRIGRDHIWVLLDLVNLVQEFPMAISLAQNGVAWRSADPGERALHDGDYFHLQFDPVLNNRHRELLSDWLLQVDIPLFSSLEGSVLESGENLSSPLSLGDPLPSSAAVASSCAPLTAFQPDSMPTLNFVCWYISHTRFRTCEESRILTFNGNYHSWISSIQALWADRFDLSADLLVSWVLPKPAGVGSGDADGYPHVIVEQNFVHRQAAVVITTTTLRPASSSVTQRALSVSEISQASTYRIAAGISEDCQSRFECEVLYDSRPISEFPPKRRPSGLAISIVLTEKLLQHSSAASLLQVSAVVRSHPAADSSQTPSSTPLRIAGIPCGGDQLSPAQRHYQWVRDDCMHQLRQMWSRLPSGPSGAQPQMRVAVYFLDPFTLPVCPFSRLVSLGSDPTEWISALVQAWADVVNPALAALVYVVNPTPLRPASIHEVALHVIVVQRASFEERAVLVNVVDGTSYSHTAMFFPPSVVRWFVLLRAGLAQRCVNPGATASCGTWQGDRVVSDTVPIDVMNGHGFHVTVLPLPSPTHLVATSVTSPGQGAHLVDVHLMRPWTSPVVATVSYDACALDSEVLAVGLSLSRSVLATCSRVEAFPAGSNLRQVWLVAAGERARSCGSQLCVVLVDVERHFVHDSGSVHINRSAQAFGASVATSSLRDLALGHDVVDRSCWSLVALLNQQVVSLSETASVALCCGDYLRLVVYQLQPGRRTSPPPAYELHSCSSLVPFFDSYLVSARPNVKSVAVPSLAPFGKPCSSGGLAALSTISVRADPGPLESASSESASAVPRVVLDLDAALGTPRDAPTKEIVLPGVSELAALLMDSGYPLQLDFPSFASWCPNLQAQFSHVQAQARLSFEHIVALQVFTDGSRVKRPELGSVVASWAFVVVGIDAVGNSCFLGYQCGRVAPRDHAHSLPGLLQDFPDALPDSFAGECEAVYRALLWMLSSGHFQSGLPRLLVSDALSAVHVSFGNWLSAHRPFLTSHVRPLEKFASSFGRLSSSWQRAHVGQLGDEVADYLARTHALSASPCVWPRGVPESLASALPWLRMSAVSSLKDVGFALSGDVLSIAQPPATGSADMCYWPSVAPPKSVTVHLDFAITTFNVTTLQQWSKCKPQASAWSSRTELLRSQASDQNLLCLQETRSRVDGHWHAPPWICFSSASSKGQGGCEIWIHGDLPLGHVVDVAGHRHPIMVSAQFCTVVCAHPRLLILRFSSPQWRMLVVSGHAPHELSEETVKQDWWQLLSSSLADFHDWPVLLGCDFNARLGEHTDAFVSSYHADAENDNGARLHSFVRSHALFLPSTFHSTSWTSQFTKGTWRSVSGWERLDYIALPVTWSASACAMSIDSVSLDNQGDDHASLTLRCQCELQGCDWSPPVSARQPFDLASLRAPGAKQVCAQLVEGCVQRLGSTLWHCSGCAP